MELEISDEQMMVKPITMQELEGIKDKILKSLASSHKGKYTDLTHEFITESNMADYESIVSLINQQYDGFGAQLQINKATVDEKDLLIKNMEH
jgi:hypothetical protein